MNNEEWESARAIQENEDSEESRLLAAGVALMGLLATGNYMSEPSKAVPEAVSLGDSLLERLRTTSRRVS